MKVVRKPFSDTCVPRGTNTTFDSTKDFVFQILHWEAVDEGPIDSPQFDDDDVDGSGKAQRCFSEHRSHAIYMTGSTKLGTSISLRTTFEPSFLLKLNAKDGKKWTKKDIETFLNSDVIRQWKTTSSRNYEGGGDDNYESACKTRYYRVFSDPDNPNKEEREESAVYLSYESAFRGWEEVMLKDLDAGFTGIDPIKFQFIRLKFSTLAAMQKCSNRMRSAEITNSLAKKHRSVALYEANIPPHIRFMHLTKVEAR